MNLLSIASQGIRFTEKILLCLILISLILRYVFNYGSTLDIFVFSGLLSMLYFPLGFYFLGKPAGNGFIISIVLGLVFSIGMVILLYGAINIEGYPILLSIYTPILMTTAIYLFIKYRSGTLPQEYIYAQGLRIIFIVITSLIVLIK